MGAGYFKRKQFVKGILMTLLEVAFILGMVFGAAPYLAKFSTLGTVEQQMAYNPLTGKNEANDYDHSFKILLYSVVAIIVIVAFIFIYLPIKKRPKIRIRIFGCIILLQNDYNSPAAYLCAISDNLIALIWSA